MDVTNAIPFFISYTIVGIIFDCKAHAEINNTSVKCFITYTFNMIGKTTDGFSYLAVINVISYIIFKIRAYF